MSKILPQLWSVPWSYIGDGQAEAKIKEAFTVISSLQHEDLSAVGVLVLFTL